MWLRQLTTAFSMTAREFLRRRGMLALMVVIPVLSFASVYAALPDTASSIDAIENGVTVRVDIDQVALFGGVSALIYAALLAGITGFYVMASAVKSDRRLILAGYSPFNLVVSRSLVLILLFAGVTLELVIIMLFFFMPKQLPVYVLSMFWGALIYGFYGALMATVIRSELGGLLAISFLANIDVGYLEIPGYSNVIGEWWAQALPGYFPVQLAIDAAFTSVPDLLGPSFWAVPHALVIGGAMLISYNRATHVHPFLPERRGLWRWVGVGVAVVLLGLAAWGGLTGYRYLQARPPAIEVEGRVDAPHTDLVSLATGRLRSVEVREGDDVHEDQIMAWVEDSVSGASLAMRAPSFGRVTRLEARTGENVVQGTVLATIHKLSELEAVLEVEETRIDEVALGQTVELTFGALGLKANSRVVDIASVPLPLDPGVSERTRKIRKYAVKAPIDDPDPRLRVGVSVKGRVFTGR